MFFSDDERPQYQYHLMAAENGARRRAAVAWTGGKDSTLALHRVVHRNDKNDNDKAADIDVVVLVSFRFESSSGMSHPAALQKLQAEALRIPLIALDVDPGRHGNDYRQAYASLIRRLRDEYGVDAIVTGDIDVVHQAGALPGGHVNFMAACCEIADCGVECILPLWNAERGALLSELSEADIDARLTCVKSPWFDASWIGRSLRDETTAGKFRSESETRGLDLCGENGEYHTCVVDAPLFRQQRIEFRIEGADKDCGDGGKECGDSSSPGAASSGDGGNNPLAVELFSRKGQGEQRWWVLSPKVELVLVDKTK